MSMSAQQYANLSSDSYSDRKQGEKVTLEGVRYEVLEHFDNPRNSYQGTIYQRVDSGEIVVAHRGTEVTQGLRPLLVDGAVVDGSMVVSRVNPQTQDAIELTRRAIEIANKNVAGYPAIPEVTVTGHSLGGCLTQITAHHFGLKGETFNAYGAASLGLGVPKGGGDVVNNVMAADFVSAASPHYGQVRLYAAQKEVAALVGAGYENNDRFVMDVRDPRIAFAKLAGSHSMHNFTNVDGDGRPDRSILADPDARQRADHYAPMFDKFRDELSVARGLATTVSTRLAPGLVGFDRDDVMKVEPAGVRGQREGTLLMETVVVPPLPEYLREGPAEPVRGSRAVPSTEFAPKTDHPEVERLVIPPLPEYLRDSGASHSTVDSSRGTVAVLLNDSAHPDQAMFRQILTGVHDEDRKRGREPDALSEQVAAGLTVDAKTRGLNKVGFLQFSADGSKAYMTDTRDPSSEFARTAAGDVGQAAQQPIAASTGKAADINQSLGLNSQQTLLAQQQTLQPNPDESGSGSRTM